MRFIFLGGWRVIGYTAWHLVPMMAMWGLGEGVGFVDFEKHLVHMGVWGYDVIWWLYGVCGVLRSLT